PIPTVEPTPTQIPTPPPPQPKPAPKPTLKPTPKPTQAERERERVERRAIAEKREQARKAREQARKAHEEARRPAQARAGKAKPSGAEIASYRSIIYSEIAQALAGVSGDGSASINFSVGASGCSVGRSSGSGEFGSLCGRIRSIAGPAPPGGGFNGRITIRLHGS